MSIQNKSEGQKEEFKNFIRLLSSEICKEILDDDLKKLNNAIMESQNTFKNNNDALVKDIGLFEKEIKNVVALTSSLKASENEIAKSNSISSKAYEHVQKTENRLIASIDGKYEKMYGNFQEECRNILNNFAVSTHEITEKHIDILDKKQAESNSMLRTSLTKCISNEFPKTLLEEIMSKCCNADRGINNLASSLAKKDVADTGHFSRIVRDIGSLNNTIRGYAYEIKKKQNVFFTVILLLNIIGYAVLGYLIYIK